MGKNWFAGWWNPQLNVRKASALENCENHTVILHSVSQRSAVLYKAYRLDRFLETLSILL